uniref:Uncharacterized protein n=1 Tax=Romanomermis culicivorax TaxID=13658 RepID=A0A915IFR1_ROMCU
MIEKPTEQWITRYSMCRIEECMQKDIKLLRLYTFITHLVQCLILPTTREQCLLGTNFLISEI